MHDADDVLQDCFLRWQGCDPRQIDDPVAYLIRITTNLCIDHLRRAKHQRTDYPGAWLPEPIVTDGPIDRIDQDVSVALLMALERLTPLERAAFLLRDVFDTDYAEVAATLDRSPSACRKLVERARSHLQDLRPRSVVSAKDAAEITRAFFQASRTGDTKNIGPFAGTGCANRHRWRRQGGRCDQCHPRSRPAAALFCGPCAQRRHRDRRALAVSAI